MDSLNIDGHKMQYHLDRLDQWSRAKTMEDKLQVYPIYVEISPVGQCNHRCTFCAVDYLGYVKRELDTWKLVHSINEMAEKGVRSVMFAGEGEPMLHREIALITRETKLAGIDVGFTTNGTAMTEEFTDKALEYCSWIKVSINGGTKEVYSKIHQCPESHWDIVWKNIRYAVSKKGETKIGVQAVLLPDNAESLVDLAQKCSESGVDYLVIKPYSQSPASITRKYSDIVYQHNFDKIIEDIMIYESSKFEITARRKTMEAWDDSDRHYSKCYSTPYFWAYIMSTGDVCGCSAHLGDKRFLYGNVNRNSFSEIWTGPERRRSIELMESFDISTCRKNCRMNHVNRFLWDVKNPGEHRNFI